MKQHTKPCAECPFARACEPGKTGGSSPLVYVGQTQGPFLLACHMSPGYHEDRRSAKHSQCAGAAIYRANIGASDRIPDALLRLAPDTKTVFASHVELVAHHFRMPKFIVERFFCEHGPEEFLLRELGDPGCQVTIQPKQT